MCVVTCAVCGNQCADSQLLLFCQFCFCVQLIYSSVRVKWKCLLERSFLQWRSECCKKKSMAIRRKVSLQFKVRAPVSQWVKILSPWPLRLSVSSSLWVCALCLHACVCPHDICVCKQMAMLGISAFATLDLAKPAWGSHLGLTSSPVDCQLVLVHRCGERQFSVVY